jgi:hypothetical protein
MPVAMAPMGQGAALYVLCLSVKMRVVSGQYLYLMGFYGGLMGFNGVLWWFSGI